MGEVKHEIVERRDEGIEGHLFAPAGAEGRCGAVIILHERYGLVQHTLDLAHKLAGDGYVAFAPDLFFAWQGDREALRRGEARVYLPDDECAGTVGRAIEFLKGDPRVDPAKIALMGVCQSGRYPVVVGSVRDDLAACVVFYGAAQKKDWQVTDLQPRAMEEMLGKLRVPALFVFGEADHIISIDDVLRVRAALEAASCSYRMKVFARAPHGFLNDTMPGRYRAAEAEQAWQMLLRFLEDVYAGNWPGGRVCWEFEVDIGRDYDFSRNVRLE